MTSAFSLIVYSLIGKNANKILGGGILVMVLEASLDLVKVPKSGIKSRFIIHSSSLVALDLHISNFQLESPTYQLFLDTHCLLMVQKYRGPIILLMEEFLHQLIGSLSHYLQGLMHPQVVVWDIFQQQYDWLVGPLPVMN